MTDTVRRFLNCPRRATVPAIVTIPTRAPLRPMVGASGATPIRVLLRARRLPVHMQRCKLQHAMLLAKVHAVATRVARPFRAIPMRRVPAGHRILLLARRRPRRPRLMLSNLWIWHCVGVLSACAPLPVPALLEVRL